MQRAKRTVRRGLTLIELLVVITLLGVLATLVAVYVLPAFSDNKNVQRGLDRATQSLLISKQRSLRDQAPRGIRFLVDNPTDPPALHRSSQFVFLEQPDAYRTGAVNPGQQGTGEQVDFLLPLGSSLYGTAGPNNIAEHLVQPGDFFRLEVGTPSNYQIQNVLSPTTVQLTRPLNPPLVQSAAGTVNYRIIRQPRPIAGENPVDLPENVVVDLGYINQIAPGNQMTVRPVPGTAPPNQQFYYEVLFDPAGTVMNRTSAAIVLWVRDATEPPPQPAGQPPLPPFPLQSDPKPHVNLLIAIYPRTGAIAQHPVADRANPLLFALDGRSSGM